MGNSRWCPTRFGLAVGRYWCGHRSAAGAQILLLGNSQSCCGGYRGLRDWCSGGGGCGAYIKGLPLLCHMFQPMHLAPLGPAVTMEPASSLEVGGKGCSDCLCMGWRGGCGVGWAWWGMQQERGVRVFYSAAVHFQFQPGALQLSQWLRIAFLLLMGHLHLPCKVRKGGKAA